MERIDRIKLGYYSELDSSKCELFDFSEDLGLVKLESGKFAFFNKNGYQAIDDLFDEAKSFENGCAEVTKNCETYFINKNNERVYPDDYKFDDGYSENLKVVQRRNGKSIYVGRDGKQYVPMELEEAEDFKNGIAKVKLIKGPVTFIDKSGRTIFKKTYKNLTDFVDGITIATLENNAHIYMDVKENQVVPGEYTGHTKAFSEELAAVQSENGFRYYYIDKNGVDVFTRLFKLAGDFHCGISRVGEIEYKYSKYINKEGKDLELMMHDEFYIENTCELNSKISELREKRHDSIEVEGYYTYFILENITIVVFDEDYNEYLKKVENIESIINQQLEEDNVQAAAEVYYTLERAKQTL